MRINTIKKLDSVLRAAKISLFDFFTKLDTSKSGKLTRLELRTGIQSMGLSFTRKEFDMLWSLLYKPKN